SNRLHSSSVSANTSSDTINAIARAAPAPCSSSPRTSSSSTAPTTGRATSEVRIGKLISTASAPQVIAENQDHAEKERGGIGAHRSGLQPPQQIGQRGDGFGRAVERVDDLPQRALGDDADRLDDDRVVDFVDVVLVREQTLHAAEPARQRVGGTT